MSLIEAQAAWENLKSISGCVNICSDPSCIITFARVCPMFALLIKLFPMSISRVYRSRSEDDFLLISMTNLDKILWKTRSTFFLQAISPCLNSIPWRVSLERILCNLINLCSQLSITKDWHWLTDRHIQGHWKYREQAGALSYIAMGNKIIQ